MRNGGLRQHVLCAADSERPKLETADVQDVEGDDVAAADLAEHVVDRHLHVVEIDGGGGTSFDAHLLFFGARLTPANARSTRNAVNFSPHLREDGEQIRRAAVGDPHLLAVQDVMRSVGSQFGAGPGSHGI